MKLTGLFFITGLSVALIHLQQNSDGAFVTEQITANNTSLKFQPPYFATYNTSDWTSGLMPDTTGSGTPTTAILNNLIIANANLKPLNVTLGGPKILVSNNPEKFTGDGWLVQHNRVDATQWGVDYPLSGTNKIYLFHINNSGAAKWVHLIMHNAGASSVTYTAKGSVYTNTDYPLPGGTAAVGQSYNVSKNWLNNTYTTNISSTIVAAGSKEEIFKKQMSAANMIDGLYEVTTSGPVYFYTIVTSNGNTNTAKNATSGTFASYTAGDYRMETSGTYAREAGIYEASEVTSENTLVIPNVQSRIGFCLNTTAKFYPVEEQTAPVVVKTPPTTDSVRLKYASQRSYGNYGFYYDVLFHLQNNSSVTKSVNVYFACNSNTINAAASNGTWNARIKLNSTGMDVYNQANNPRKKIATLNIPAGTTDMTLQFYVPGLITANQQLIFENTTTAISLPVSFSDVTAANKDGINTIQWKVAQEFDLSHYEVQKSNDGNNFTTIKRAEANNNYGASVYTCNDAALTHLSGNYYYRIKSVNLNGSSDYSKTVSLKLKATSKFEIAGNPFSSQLTVKYESLLKLPVQMSLYNLQGKTVLSHTETSNGSPSSYTFTNLSSIIPGVYLFEIIIGKERFTEQIVKTAK
jgi:Protein of unknown function (DUF3370)